MTGKGASTAYTAGEHRERSQRAFIAGAAHAAGIQPHEMANAGSMPAFSLPLTFCGSCQSAPCGCRSILPPPALPSTQLSNDQLHARISDLQRQLDAAVEELGRRTLSGS